MSRPPTTAPHGAERDLLDRLLVRAPALVASIAGGVRRIPPSSSLRRRLVNLQVRRTFVAMTRGDVEVVALVYESGAEIWMNGLAGVGLSGCYRGLEGVRAIYADFDEAFDTKRWIVRGVADDGDRVVVRVNFAGHGRSSGAATTLNDSGTVIELSARGLIARQDWFVEPDGWNKALDAVGLSE